MPPPSYASVRDHVRTVLEKLEDHRKERTTDEDEKVVPDRGPHSSRKAAFAERLKAAIERRGWSLNETARQTASVLGADAKFSRSHLWHYLHARALPRARYRAALSHALEVRPDDLLPSKSPRRAEALSGTLPGIRAQDQGDGTVYLEVSQRVPWQRALEVMRLLNLPYDDSRSDHDPSEHS